MNRLKFGKKAEKAVEKEYEKRGYKHIESNFHSRFGEIDIIVCTDEYIVFAEVKARGEGMLYLPAEAVNASKQNKIRRTAETYLYKNESGLQPRFDVCEVFVKDGKIDQINIIENAFW